MKNILFLVFLLTACTGLSESPKAPVVRTGDVVSNATDLIIKKFSATSGIDFGKPYLSIEAVVSLPLGGAEVELVLDKVLDTDMDTYYLVRPRRGASTPGTSVELESEGTFHHVVKGVKWRKTYHFIVLNYTGGLSASHGSVYTYSVPMFEEQE